jgi:hypothetical protein
MRVSFASKQDLTDEGHDGSDCGIVSHIKDWCCFKMEDLAIPASQSIVSPNGILLNRVQYVAEQISL